jgi:Restriction endonuclease
MQDSGGDLEARATSETTQKGHILEDVAEMLYSTPGVKIQKRVKLRPPGENRPEREIDVLITASVVGYLVQFAVECKNEKEPVGADKIDAFRGKLQLLHIPVQHGIYVSPTGFTEGALDAARDVGIRTFVLKGLTRDRLQAELLEAVQSIVFYLAYVKELAWDAPGIPEGDPSRFQFYDGQSKPAGTPPDFLWKAWQWDEAIPLAVGEYEVPIELPNGCHAVRDGVEYPVAWIRGKLGVKAFVLQRGGTATDFELRNPADDSLDRQRIRMEFAAAAGLFELRPFETQEELDAFMEEQGPYHFALRVRIPRIQYDYAFWPLSPRVRGFFDQQQKLFEEGKIEEFGPYTQHQVEGDNLAVAFEAIVIGDQLVSPRAYVVSQHGGIEIALSADDQD